MNIWKKSFTCPKFWCKISSRSVCWWQLKTNVIYHLIFIHCPKSAFFPQIYLFIGKVLLLMKHCLPRIKFNIISSTMIHIFCRILRTFVNGYLACM
uniref:Uncharacterized protein n=1 Tax=Octopus bimaculoides TaxID=37653 RepID=A0A0L8GLM4_OCTBM